MCGTRRTQHTDSRLRPTPNKSSLGFLPACFPVIFFNWVLDYVIRLPRGSIHPDTLWPFSIRVYVWPLEWCNFLMPLAPVRLFSANLFLTLCLSKCLSGHPSFYVLSPIEYSHFLLSFCPLSISYSIFLRPLVMSCKLAHFAGIGKQFSKICFNRVCCNQSK